MSDMFYSTKEWQRLRQKVKKRDHMICRMCGSTCNGKYNSHVDHIISRRLRPDLAHDINNLQLLCGNCHNSKKQSEEKRDPNRGVDNFGIPLDSNSIWANWKEE